MLTVQIKDIFELSKYTDILKSDIKVMTPNGLKKVYDVDITSYNSDVITIKTHKHELMCSPDHLIKSNNKWIKSKDFKINDPIDTKYGTFRVKEMSISVEQEDLLDLHVDGNEYYTNDILSHNSSLLESIDFSLFNIVRGKNTKRVPLYILPNRTNKNLETEIDFINWNNDHVVINKKLNPKGFNISINGINKTNQYDLMMQQDKDDIIGIDYNTYKSLISLNLADFANFINLDTDTKRKLLNKMFNIEELDSYLSIAKELLKNGYLKREKIETKIITNKNVIETYKNNIESILLKSDTIDREEIKSKLLSLKDKYIALKSEINDINLLIRGLDPIIESKREVYMSKKKKISIDEFNLNELNKKIDIFKSGTCPFCGSILTDDVHKIDRESLEIDYNENSSDLLELKRSFNTLRNDIGGNIAEKKKLIDDRNIKKEDIVKIKNEIIDLKRMYKSDINVISIDEINKNIRNLEEENIRYDKGLNMLNDKIQNYQKLVDVLSEKGIRKGIINNIVDPINEHLAKYLIELESNYNVKLNDEFDAVIKKYSDEIHIESLSTGEARKINVAIALSYMEIILSMNKKTNILFMDEVFASVDPDNIDIMLKVLRTFSENNNISVIIVNHSQFDTAKFDRVIEIEKKLGFSFIKES